MLAGEAAGKDGETVEGGWARKTPTKISPGFLF